MHTRIADMEEETATYGRMMSIVDWIDRLESKLTFKCIQKLIKKLMEEHNLKIIEVRFFKFNLLVRLQSLLLQAYNQ